MNTKRLIAFLLCIMMLVSLLPAALAEGEIADDEEIVCAEDEIIADEAPAEEKIPAADETSDEEIIPDAEEPAEEEIPEEEEPADEAIGDEEEESAADEIADDEIPDEPEAEDEENEFEAASGTCGENLNWTLDSSGKLTISGSGAMSNYTSSEPAPWSSYTVSSVIIESGATSIGSYAFYRNASLASVSIPASVTVIGKYAFYKCTALASVSVPEGVTSIGNYCFNGCAALASVTLPASLTSIGTLALDDCSNAVITYNGTIAQWEALGYVTENDVICSDGSSIVPVASGSCGENLTWALTQKGTLIISGTGAMKEWGYSTGAPWYSHRTEIKTIDITDGVTRICNYAFQGCSLTSITIPNSVTSIGGSAFYGCSSLTSITIPSSVTSIGGSAFYSCSRLKTLYYDGTAADWCGISFSGKDANPGFYASEIYFNGSKVTELEIPDSITKIGDYAFQGFKMTSVSISDSVTSIGHYAFQNCGSLTSFTVRGGSNPASITIPDGVTSIGREAFRGCNSLTSIIIPNSVTSIGYRVFSGKFVFYAGSAEQWKSVSRYNEIDALGVHYNSTGQHSFDEGICSFCGFADESIFDTTSASGKCGDNLTWTLLSDGRFFIRGSGAMYGWEGYDAVPWSSCLTSITKIIIADGVTNIGKLAFYGCSSLTDLTIGSGVASIGREAFRGCYGLTSITIPNSVTSIDNQAFQGCSGLTKVSMADSVTSLGSNVFAYCSKLKNITLSDSLTSLGESMFYNCSGLTGITIPDSVTYIRTQAFRGCTGITSITIPESVTRIDGGAFNSCTGLKTIAFRGDAPSIGSADTFYNVTATAYYPAGNSTWTSSVMQQYGGTITWKAGSPPSVPVNKTAPVISSLDNHADYMIVRWGKVEGATSYKLAYRAGSGAWQIMNVSVSSVDGKGNPRVNIKGLTTGTTYTFIAYAIFADGTQTKSASATQIRLLSPTVKVNKYGTTAANGGFRVSWNATEGGSQYKIYYREKGTSSWTLYAKIPKSANTLFVNIKGSVTNADSKFPDLVAGKTYEFAVLTATSQAGITSGFPTSYTGYKF